MSFDVSALSAYVEDRDFPLIGEAQVMPEMTAGEATVVPGLKGKSNIHYMETDLVIQSASGCTRTANGTTTFSDKEIEVNPMAVSEDLCLEDFRQTWAQILLSRGTQEGREIMPTEVAEIYFEEKAMKLAQSLDIADWQQDGTLYNGWLYALDNAVDVVNGNPTGITVATGITTTNIIGILQGMWQLQTDELAEMDDVTIYLSKVNYDKYILALINADLYNYMGKDGDTMLFGTNVRIRPTYGLKGSNRIVLTYPKNLIVGVDGENDGDFSYRIDPVTNKKILVDADFTRGCQIYFTDQVVDFVLVP